MSDDSWKTVVAGQRRALSFGLLVAFIVAAFAGAAARLTALSVVGVVGASLTVFVMDMPSWLDFRTRRRASGAAAHHASTRMCRNCEYRLEGLGETGRCPECGTDYPPFDYVRSPMPLGQICLALAWPVLGASCFFVFAVWGLVADMDTLSAVGGIGCAFMALMSLLNTPLQLINLASHHAPPGRRFGSFVAHLSVRGRIAVWIALGACVAFWAAIFALASLVPN